MGPAAKAQHDRICTSHDMEHACHDRSSNSGHSFTWGVERERGRSQIEDSPKGLRRDLTGGPTRNPDTPSPVRMRNDQWE